MAQTIEYRTSNRKIRYPFDDDSIIYRDPIISASSDSSSEDVIALEDNLAILVFGCFIDANIQIKSPYLEKVPCITGIRISSHTLSFTLYDKNSSLSERVSLRCTRSTTAFPVIKGECNWCWYTFVLSSAGLREYEEQNVNIGSISLTNLNFSSRCIGKSATHVSSIWVYGGEKRDDNGNLYKRPEAMALPPDEIVTGDVRIMPGYNMRFNEDTDGFSLNAIPGAGMGYAPCGCQDDDTVFKTPGLLSKDGHSRLFNDTCYDLLPILNSKKSGLLRMHVKCKACCTCEMYADIVNRRLIPLRDKILEDKAKIDYTFTTYETNVQKWNNRIESVLPEDIIVTTTAVPLDAAATDLTGTNISGKMNRCGFSIIMRNDSFAQVKFTIDKFSSNGEPFEAQISYTGPNMEPVILPIDLSVKKSPIATVTLHPGRTATVVFFVRIEKLVSTDEQSGFSATSVISAYHNSTLIDTRNVTIVI